jgi:hypothetical protein
MLPRSEELDEADAKESLLELESRRIESEFILPIPDICIAIVNSDLLPFSCSVLPTTCSFYVSDQAG